MTDPRETVKNALGEAMATLAYLGHEPVMGCNVDEEARNGTITVSVGDRALYTITIDASTELGAVIGRWCTESLEALGLGEYAEAVRDQTARRVS